MEMGGDGMGNPLRFCTFFVRTCTSIILSISAHMHFHDRSKSV